MEEALRRAQMYIDAIRGCSIHASIATVKCYACDLDKELAFIKAEGQRLEAQVQRLEASNKPKSGLYWGKQKPSSCGWSPQKPKPVPPPEEKK